MDVQVLSVSSKGQIALPIKFRKALSIHAGDQLAAYTDGDTILLKILKMPSDAEIMASFDAAKEWAEQAGYEEPDVDDLIQDIRDSRNK